MRLFLLFVTIPIIEIALFIQVGGFLGLFPTLAIVILTALAGTLLVRSQGASALAEIQRTFSELRDPSEALANGAMILAAGLLLLTPGFFTDAVGLAFLLPPVRKTVFRWARSKIDVKTMATGSNRPPERNTTGDIIDAEYEITDPPPSESQGSGWTRH